MSKNVVIIGAGIAGLSAGVYSVRSGFKTTILESHIIPGGLSTSWKRKNYLFEGGMHWLTGSSEKLALNKVWKQVGALKENNPIFYKDPIYTFIKDGRKLCLFRDLKKLRSHFLEYAPEDTKMINRLCADVKAFLNVHMVVQDIIKVKVSEKTKPSIFELIKMIPAGLKLNRLNNESYTHYINRFKNKDIRSLLLSVIGSRYNALSFIYTLASFASGDCGYPEGGSLRLTQNMADTFTSLGGTIQYRTMAEKIILKDGKISGIQTSNGFIECENVIVTQDTRKAIDFLFEKPLDERWCKKMRKNVVTEQNMFICLGVKMNLENLPRCFVISLDESFSAGGIDFNELRINNYALYKNHSPENCTTLTCLLLGHCYDYWKKAKEDGTYKEKKQLLAEKFIDVLEKTIPGIKENIEVIDVATPMTYERYCNSFQGSWMSVWEPHGKQWNYPIKSQSVKGLYFASQRTMMPGGLPIAVCAGRFAAQHLCKDNDTVFVCN